MPLVFKRVTMHENLKNYVVELDRPHHIYSKGLFHGLRRNCESGQLGKYSKLKGLQKCAMPELSDSPSVILFNPRGNFAK